MLKKFVLPALIAIHFLNPSRASTNVVDRALVYQKQHTSSTPMRTRSVLVLAVPKHQRKFIVTSDLVEDENDDLPGPSELDLHVFYARPKLVNKEKSITEEPDELSDYVTVRLAVARAKALEAYRNKWM